MNKKSSSWSNEDRKKQNLIKLFIVVMIIVIFASLSIVKTEFRADKLLTTHVSVEEAVSELQFTVYSKEEWDDFFKDYKEVYITREMVYDILTKLGTAKVIPFDEAGMQKPVNRMEWNNIYQQVVDYLDIENRIFFQNVLVLACEKGKERQILYTNEGTYTTTLPSTYFSEWSSYDVYMLGEECVGIIGEVKQENIIANTYITGASEDELTFLFNQQIYSKKANLKGLAIQEGVADISFCEREIFKIAQKKDYIEGHLLSYDDSIIEIEGYGRIAHDKKLPVYRAYDTVDELNIEDIVLGNMDVKYIVGNEEVCAILITAPAEILQVRVLLLAEDGGKFREDVYLIGNGDITISNGEMSRCIPAETVIKSSDYLEDVEGTLIMTPDTEETLMYICNENGKKISNGYSGNMEVRQYENGYCLVNEVDFETYLYSVVPSEMPSNYQMEALKAQAVCARSYAYMQVIRADLAAYGAHINDSSSYQVYNNIAKTQASVNAVDETAGTVMLHEGNVVEAYYFSTSMGYTDTEEVWNPAEDTEGGYLKQVCLNEQRFEGDLSNDKVFKEYLAFDTNGYDSDIKFYRWKIKADYSELTETVKEILRTRRASLKRHITYYKIDGKTEVDSMKNFGDLVSLEVAKRSDSGCILELMVNFENGTAKVENEYNIRKILGCGADEITYKDESKGVLGGLIPSAFCTIEKQADGTYLLCGGGYGHGIGMSQNGANGLAKAGYSYSDILNYFYKDIELVDIRS